MKKPKSVVKSISEILASTEPSPAVRAAPEKSSRPRQASRVDKKYLSFVVDRAAGRQLAVLAAEEEMDQQDLLRMGLNMVFEHFKRPPIA